MHAPIFRRLRSLPHGAACLGALYLASPSRAVPPSERPAAHCNAVDPFIGTAGGGNTFPGATLPFGMIQWGPDTRSDGWYHFGDRTIRGLSLTHISGAGCPIYGDVPILPWIGGVPAHGSPRDLALGFSHEHERAHPGYYAVKFDDGIRAGLTVADRAGIGRFVFPGGAKRTFLIKAACSAVRDGFDVRMADGTAVEVRAPDMVAGTVHSGGFCGSQDTYTLYFVLRFSRPFAAFGTWSGAVQQPGRDSASGPKVGAYVSFPAGTDPIVAKVGLSFVSVDNAAANLQKEIPGWDFDRVRAAAAGRWEKTLDAVDATGGTPEQRTLFYTALYHMMLSPNLFSDEGGDYVGFDGRIRRLGPREAQYANFSDWDIYRDVIPWDALLFPARTSQFVQSLVRDAEQSGWLPRWPVANDVSYVMGGDSASILLSEAYAFGARGFDTRTALRYMLKGATQPGTGPHGRSEREGLRDYLSKGYLPTVAGGNEAGASMTLEYATSDFAISRFAGSLGDSADALRLLRSSQNWRHLFDSRSDFIRPRTADGRFLAPWDPDRLMPRHKNWDTDDQLGFEEGSTWQYTWMIPFDYAGLFRAMGGNDKVLPKLDKFFRQLSGWGLPTFTVTNEPDFCAPYAYVWARSPWKTQEVIDRVRRETFSARPDGLPGNDDLGATSGVYMWSALGMYPVVPGVGGVVLGTPMFPRAVVHLGDGRTLEITARGSGIYVQAVALNGKSLSGAWLPLEDLGPGVNRLEFSLGPRPNKAWGASPADLPPSYEPPGGPLARRGERGVNRRMGVIGSGSFL